MSTAPFLPRHEVRAFRPGKRYSEIDWSQFDEVLSEFHQRIEAWYLTPAKNLGQNKDHGFTVIALCALVIDTLSQYEDGAFSSSGRRYTQYLRSRFSVFATPLSSPVTITVSGQPKQLDDLADVFYSAFRCGILHEAHVIPLGAISEDDESVIKESKQVATTYPDGTDCPTILVNPTSLLAAVSLRFEDYVRDLGKSSNATLRANFKKKLEHCYGVNLGAV